MQNFEKLSNCRICESTELELILALGDQPLANSLKSAADANENKYPLTLKFCRDCSLVQLEETVAKEILFQKYVWVTGTSSTARQFAEDFCENILKVSAAQKDSDYILEIASNDGTFLRPFQNRGYRVVGIDPAKNICEMAEKSGIPSIAEFWGSASASKIENKMGKAKVIFARNVIPHVADLKDVILGIKNCLAPNGTGAIEFHYGRKILEELQYDSIYHEHLCYFSIKTMEFLLQKFGLFGFHIDPSPISGGALILYFGHERKIQTPQYTKFASSENDISLNELKTWQNFGARCRKHRELSWDLLRPFAGQRIVAFGASARSSTYLNFCEFSFEEISAVIDNSPQKQNLFTAGSSIPIVKMEDGLIPKPDLLFLLAWNFTQEALGLLKERGYRGPVLIPFPGEPKVILI